MRASAIQHVIQRLPSALVTTIRCVPLFIRNIVSRGPIASGRSCDPDVAVATHGTRVRSAFLTIESITRGEYQPGRIYLYIDVKDFESGIPRSLKRLAARGLEIVPVSEHYGPHTKYYPYISTADDAGSTALVTADDDILYPRFWLSKLAQSSKENPRCIVAFRAKRLGFDSVGRLLGYREWAEVNDIEGSIANFATGVSGVLYPREFLDSLRGAGDDFLRVAPKADDIWLHVQAVRSATKVKQVEPTAVHFPVIPFTQTIALWRVNDVGDMNDEQAGATYTSDDLAALRSAISESARLETEG